MAGPPSTVYKLNYSRRRITDDSLHHLRRELPLRQDSYPYEEVDFSQNELSSGGLHVVLDVCRRCPKLRVLKLYKNQIDDGGAEGLAELCKQCPAIEEMHLSHNHFTAVGVEVLITAAEQARPTHVSPLWLRLEQNDVAEPDAVFRDLSTRLSVCNRMDEVRCTVRVCCRKQKVHLPFFHLQRSSRLRDSMPGFGGAPSYRVPSPTYSPSQSVVPKHGLPAPTMSRVGTPKCGLTPSSSTGCAWDLNGAGAARRFGAAAPGPGAGGAPGPGSGHGPGPGPGPGHGPGPGPGPGHGPGPGPGPGTGPRPGHQPGPPPGPGPGPGPGAGAVVGPGSAAPAGAPASDTASEGATATEKPPVEKIAVATPAAAVPPPPPPKPAATTGAAGCPPEPTETSASTEAQKREGGMENVDMSPTPARQRKAPDPDEPGLRASLVLDGQGRRRILPTQLEAEGASSQFVCPICTFVIIRPVITSCSHLFCDTCFRNWVGEQVSKMKKGMPGDGPVPLIQCPQPKCTMKLRKRDIMPMDKADSTKVGAVQLLQRLRNNLQIRCVHHVDHYEYSFGQDAERVQSETGMTCKWIGDLAAYEEHVCKGCPIETHLGGPPAGLGAGGAENGRSSPAASTEQDSPKASPKAAPAEEAAAPKAASAAAQQPASPSRSAAAGDGAEAQAQKSEPAPADAGETRVARYDYVPRETDKAQIALKTNDLLRIFEVTESGWAAGVRLCRETMQEVGEAGWFPAGYLYPPDHVATA